MVSLKVRLYLSRIVQNSLIHKRKKLNVSSVRKGSIKKSMTKCEHKKLRSDRSAKGKNAYKCDWTI